MILSVNGIGAAGNAEAVEERSESASADAHRHANQGPGSAAWLRSPRYTGSNPASRINR